MSGLLQPSSNIWRAERADEFAIIIDADDYFSAARAAMRSARKSIFLVGWDFDASITLGRPGEQYEEPSRVGDYLLWLAEENPNLEIRLLLWNPGFLSSWTKLSNLPYLLRWKLHPRITVLLDGNHPVGSSHHQKILVIDDAIAFCGGIDVTAGRWDTRKHLDNDPLRRRPNGVLYGPWHDASSFCAGPAAKALGDLCRSRWKSAGGEQLAPTDFPHVSPSIKGAISFGRVTLGISRTVPLYANQAAVAEIERLYVDMIMSAKRVIYAESQYFASRIIAQALARRLSEIDGPEVILINPVKADNWLGEIAMDTARARLREALRSHDPHGRFRMYHPVTAGGVPIYVHSKLMMVDDKAIRVGSSNFNNRSMRFDNECDVVFEAGRDDQLSGKLVQLRDNLLAEHLGVDTDEVTRTIGRTKSIIAAIEELREKRTVDQPGNRPTLIPYQTPAISGLEQWLADNEILDPEGPEAVMEPIERRGLFRGHLKLPSKKKPRSAIRGPN
ncbi:phosphatidylserine/phosphatidylglycerophosphate/cardiolipin synthase-like enzyme [Rhizobium sp. BK529]|uniref:phospholipase D-like domain-containing protein n=1 Tax=Rhizobium sp. BK529 TaxID=2586983 RepID=UPI0016080F4C|nr:phospholipase D-like domain-containing protein [Rhizobium sp. BK529]MBB3595124.1 phosphatidylserine/phosphatidylglycerophosphate/cardiolipin synthase-like enzyme [Rhizobium sp. BK529]